MTGNNTSGSWIAQRYFIYPYNHFVSRIWFPFYKQQSWGPQIIMFLILGHVGNNGGFQIQVYQPISVSMWQWKSETVSQHYCSADMKSGPCSAIIPRESLHCCLNFAYGPISLHFPICKVRCCPWQALRPLPSPTLVFTPWLPRVLAEGHQH